MSSLRLTWLLVALNLLVLFWAVSVYQYEYQDEAAGQSTLKKGVELPDFPVFIPQVGEDYPDILERPLFNELRSLAESETGEIVKVTKNRDNRSLLKLVGVVLLPEGSRALILKPDRTIEKVAPGQKVDGWELLSINDDSVQLEQSGKKLQLQLERKSEPQSKRKQRTGPVRRKQGSRKPERG